MAKKQMQVSQEESQKWESQKKTNERNDGFCHAKTFV